MHTKKFCHFCRLLRCVIFLLKLLAKAKEVVENGRRADDDDDDHDDDDDDSDDERDVDQAERKDSATERMHQVHDCRHRLPHAALGSNAPLIDLLISVLCVCVGGGIVYRTDGGIFNLRWLQVKSRVHQTAVVEFQFADVLTPKPKCSISWTCSPRPMSVWGFN